MVTVTAWRTCSVAGASDDGQAAESTDSKRGTASAARSFPLVGSWLTIVRRSRPFIIDCRLLCDPPEVIP